MEYSAVPRVSARLVKIAFCVGLATCARGAEAADAYPNHPIRMLVGFSAGGATDITARLIAQHLAQRLEQSITVENRPGAGGSIAANIVAKAPPDGYTLLYTSAAHAINPALDKKLPFDSVSDFTPLSTVTTTLNALIVNPKLPVRTAAEFIAYAKTHPGKVSMASTGIGSSSYMAELAFDTEAGIEVNHIPYKGTNEALRDMVTGEVQVTIDAVTAYLPYIRNGSLIAICGGDVKRNVLLPDVPICAESGLPGYKVRSWQGILTTAHVPTQIVEKLSREINAVLKMPETIQQLQTNGARPLGSTPEEFREIIKSDIAHNTNLIKQAGVERQ